MRYNILKGQYPFQEVIGTVEAPMDMPEVALQRAKRSLAEKASSLPEEEAVFYRHPVVELEEPLDPSDLVTARAAREYALDDVPF